MFYMWLYFISGPPGTVSAISISSVTDSAVTVAFRPGYNYNTTQTFAIETPKGDKWKGFYLLSS